MSVFVLAPRIGERISLGKGAGNVLVVEHVTRLLGWEGPKTHFGTPNPGATTHGGHSCILFVSPRSEVFRLAK